MSMKIFNDTIGNRTRDLPAFSAVPQLPASPRASGMYHCALKCCGLLVNNELYRKWKEMAAPLFNVMSRKFSGGSDKTAKAISQDSRSVGLDLNPGPPEYEAGVLLDHEFRHFRLLGPNIGLLLIPSFLTLSVHAILLVTRQSFTRIITIKF
jgi:hypothetical protein